MDPNTVTDAETVSWPASGRHISRGDKSTRMVAVPSSFLKQVTKTAALYETSGVAVYPTKCTPYPDFSTRSLH